DVLRGLVILLMTIDHSSDAFNAGRVFTDSAFRYHHEPLPLAQFLTRWITHVCAPSFVFLAGASLALSVEARMKRGASPGSIDRHIVARGLFLAALDPVWMTLAFLGGWSRFLCQVMYAIGMSLVAMALLRRLPSWALVAFSVVAIGTVDFLVGHAVEHTSMSPSSPPWLVSALVTGGLQGRVIFAYPVLPWLSIMMLGWAFGRRLARDPSWRPERLLAIVGVVALAIFAGLRGVDGFGNAGLHRDDGSIAQWLHVSKYPPSVTYVALELGLMALLLAACFWLDRDAVERRWTRVLQTLGETSLFYYLLHVHLLMIVSYALGVHQKLGLKATYAGAAAIAIALSIASKRYGLYKRAHDNLVTRWI
ncbi:MAG: DUF1624 domain-containing protein, partial [Polyangiales bacterium]